MYTEKENIEITIHYPRRQGYIMEAHTLSRHLDRTFGVSALLEEQQDDEFTVILNGKPIYSHVTEEDSGIDHQKILSSVGGYAKPLMMCHADTVPPDDNDDPDHIQWMNSFCSGE